jgi:serine-type D-Ala-D-Ala carboxypeptidase/endopeptidase
VARIVGAFIMAWLVATGLSSPVVGAAPVALDRVVAPLAQAYLAKHGGQLSVGLLQSGRTTVLGYGNAGAQPSANYEIGSIGKTMAGLILAHAVVEGRVALQDDVREYLDGDYPNLAFDGEPVRLIHLANMTSALPDNIPDLSGVPVFADKVAALRVYSKSKFLADLHAAKLTAKPGDQPAHSNASAQLLAYVLERVYGQPYEALLARYVEDPLGMAKTGTGPLAVGRDETGAVAPRLDTPFSRPTGGLSYAVADMLKYVAHQIAEPDAAVRLTHQGTWFTLDRKLSVGFFWIMGQTPSGGQRLRYSGGTFGFSSFCDLYPEEQLGVVLQSSVADPSAQDDLQVLSETLVEQLRGAK